MDMHVNVNTHPHQSPYITLALSQSMRIIMDSSADVRQTLKNERTATPIPSLFSVEAAALAEDGCEHIVTSVEPGVERLTTLMRLTPQSV